MYEWRLATAADLEVGDEADTVVGLSHQVGHLLLTQAQLLSQGLRVRRGRKVNGRRVWKGVWKRKMERV